ncbi:MAG: hypothetical protein EA426_03680 [Spirochaetaceae bacterium]|nr:MAG: hypothetical protein EA426_03680 [Spirochaetaceae bacterium]
MKKSVVLLLSLIVAAGIAYGETTGNGNTFRFDFTTAYTVSVEQHHITVTPALTRRIGQIGFGAGLKAYIGIGHEGRYLTPHARFEIFDVVVISPPDGGPSSTGSLYIGLGPSIMVVPPETPRGALGGTMLLVGLHNPVLPAGPGYVALDLGLEISPPRRDRSGDLFDDEIINALAFFWDRWAGYRWKLNVGLTYALPF